MRNAFYSLSTSKSFIDAASDLLLATTQGGFIARRPPQHRFHHTIVTGLGDVVRAQVINRSAKYKNKYVHRRDSVSLTNLTLQELQTRVDLGLVRSSDSEDGSEDVEVTQ